jgi:C1A family cysteine protease
MEKIVTRPRDASQFCVRPSVPDSRDRAYVQRRIAVRNRVDLREWDSPVEDQSALGSCVAHAVTSAYELMVRQHYPGQFVELSRLFVYYNTREIEGTLNEDSGVYYLRNALQAVQKKGICREEVWPYQLHQWDEQPSEECYQDGATRVITEYTRLTTHDQVLDAINYGRPVVVGMYIYNEFLEITADNPVVPMPADPAVDLVGGHAVVIVGYDLERQQYLIKNSFGLEWGDQGYAWLPFDYAIYMFEQWSFGINDQYNVDFSTIEPDSRATAAVPAVDLVAAH